MYAMRMGLDRSVQACGPGAWGSIPVRPLAAALLALAVALTLAGCASDRTTVRLGGETLRVFVADDDAERSQGLQGYKPLEPGEGMLFVFEDEAPRTFIMKDVTFPIDVVFIGADDRVSAIEPLGPGDTHFAFSPGDSRYVLELPQGWAAESGIGVGSEFEPR